MLDPFGAIAEIIIGLKGASQIEKWTRLLFSMGMSYLLAASTATGGALIGGASVPVSMGWGLISGAAFALVAYLRMDKRVTEGTVIAVPQRTVTDSVSSDGQGPMVSK